MACDTMITSHLLHEVELKLKTALFYEIPRMHKTVLLQNSYSHLSINPNDRNHRLRTGSPIRVDGIFFACVRLRRRLLLHRSDG